MRRLLLPFCLFVILLNPTISLADGEGTITTPSPEERLPPILPGETVERGGKKLRVITSAGPVVTDPNVELEQDRERIEVDDIDVIVDTRKNRPNGAVTPE